MKKTFTIKLNTEFDIDFTSWGLSDAEQRGGDATRKLIIDVYLDACGMDEFEVQEKTACSLFETIAEVIRAQNECEHTINRKIIQ